jgi:hypothetical protein
MEEPFMDNKISVLIEKFLNEIENILYLDDKYNDKNMADRILKIIEEIYDL